MADGAGGGDDESCMRDGSVGAGQGRVGGGMKGQSEAGVRKLVARGGGAVAVPVGPWLNERTEVWKTEQLSCSTSGSEAEADSARSILLRGMWFGFADRLSRGRRKELLTC